jgi:hypothetical protein
MDSIGVDVLEDEEFKKKREEVKKRKELRKQMKIQQKNLKILQKESKTSPALKFENNTLSNYVNVSSTSSVVVPSQKIKQLLYLSRNSSSKSSNSTQSKLTVNPLLTNSFSLINEIVSIITSIKSENEKFPISFGFSINFI